MTYTDVVGVDPGLVHTGVVVLTFDSQRREIIVQHEAVAGPDAPAVNGWIYGATNNPATDIFIEGYRPRSHFNSDERMVEAVANIRKATGGTVLNNTGIKSVVKQPLLELLGCWRFNTPTHHDDLRSAARIAVLGMLKNDTYNALLTRVVRDHLAGRTWRVHR